MVVTQRTYDRDNGTWQNDDVFVSTLSIIHHYRRICPSVFRIPRIVIMYCTYAYTSIYVCDVCIYARLHIIIIIVIPFRNHKRSLYLEFFFPRLGHFFPWLYLKNGSNVARMRRHSYSQNTPPKSLWLRANTYNLEEGCIACTTIGSNDE